MLDPIYLLRTQQGEKKKAPALMEFIFSNILHIHAIDTLMYHDPNYP